MDTVAFRPPDVVLHVVVLGVADGLVDRDDGLPQCAKAPGLRLALVFGADAPQAEPMDPRALLPETSEERLSIKQVEAARGLDSVESRGRGASLTSKSLKRPGFLGPKLALRSLKSQPESIQVVEMLILRQRAETWRLSGASVTQWQQLLDCFRPFCGYSMGCPTAPWKSSTRSSSCVASTSFTEVKSRSSRLM